MLKESRPMTILRTLFGREKVKAIGKSGRRPGSSDLAEELRPEGFRDPEKLAAYVAAELRGCVPEGWRVERFVPTLAWAIKKECLGPDEWPNQEYDLWITKDLELLVITHSNCDVGPGPIYENAVVMRVELLRCRGELSTAMRHVISSFKPNAWGYT